MFCAAADTAMANSKSIKTPADFIFCILPAIRAHVARFLDNHSELASEGRIHEEWIRQDGLAMPRSPRGRYANQRGINVDSLATHTQLSPRRIQVSVKRSCRR